MRLIRWNFKYKRITTFFLLIFAFEIVYSQNAIIIDAGSVATKLSPLFKNEYKDINFRIGPSIGITKCNYFKFNQQLYYNIGIKYQRIGEKYYNVEPSNQGNSAAYLVSPYPNRGTIQTNNDPNNHYDLYC